MIKILAFSAISLFVGTCSKVDLSVINNYVSPTTTPTAPKPSNEEVVSGLKEALNVGIKNAVNITSVTDGFLKNESIRLPFPPDAIKARQKAIDLGMTAQVEKFETTLNRAAEEASKEAILIFADAITNMSIQDGFTILKGGEGAATNYLKEQTTAKLTAAFSPKVAEAISKVKLTEYWSPIMTKYNTAMTLTGGEKINPDLNAYVTQKAIEGLFKMVALEENKIRKDPAARVSDLLIKVFGSL
jgi:D-ribose pyranose/furanose isomerase RbsD